LLLLACSALPSCGSDEEKSEADRLYDECLGNAMGDATAEMQCYQIKAQAEAGQMGGIVGEGGDEASGANDQLPETAGEFEACATGGASADFVVSAMLLVVDKSSSMNNDNKWNQASAALVSFLQSPETSGLSIGLRFYPDDHSDDGGPELCNGEDCSEEACATPMIESAELNNQSGAADPQETALVQAIQGTSAWGDEGRGTPTHAALGGGLSWAREYQADHDGESAIVVLVTDGEPNGCNDNNTAIAGLAADAFQAEGIRTYAIGLEGSQEPQMDEIAEAGGTNEGIFIGSENAEQDLLAALAGIRGEVLGCEFPVPDPENGELNPNQVNIVLTSNGTDTQFSKVEDEDQCGDELSWYFASGSSIELCPAACNVTLADPNASIGLVFGCNTGEPVITGEQAR
jgi:hypothetical protein